MKAVTMEASFTQAHLKLLFLQTYIFETVKLDNLSLKNCITSNLRQ